MTSVCFIPPRRRQIRRLRSRGRLWAGVSAGLALMLACVFGLLVMQGDQPDGGVGAELARAREQLDRDTRRCRDVETRITRDGAELARVKAIGKHPDWSVLLRLLAGARGNDVVLDRVSIAEAGGQKPGARPGSEPSRTGSPGAAAGAGKGTDSFTIHLGGQARSQEYAAAYTRRLEELGLFDRVRIIETRLVNVQGREYAAFQIECVVGSMVRPAGADRVGSVDERKAGGS